MTHGGRDRDENDSPGDTPWGQNRRQGGRAPGGRQRGWQGGAWQGGWQGGSWQGGPPRWVQGLINLAQSGAEFGGQRHFAHRGPKVRRGDVRAAILDVLSVEPMNGYQIIQQIAERSGGAWKPSPGSLYPTVQQLEDEGLVEGREGEGRRLLQLTEEGRRYVEE